MSNPSVLSDETFLLSLLCTVVIYSHVQTPGSVRAGTLSVLFAMPSSATSRMPGPLQGLGKYLWNECLSSSGLWITRGQGLCLDYIWYRVRAQWVNIMNKYIFILRSKLVSRIKRSSRRTCLVVDVTLPNSCLADMGKLGLEGMPLVMPPTLVSKDKDTCHPI